MQPWLLIIFILVSCYAQSAVKEGERAYKNWTSSYTRSPQIHKCPKYCALIAKYSSAYDVPQKLTISVIKNESNFNPRAVSPKGAKGLMQLMDINSKAANINPFIPEQNIQVGTKLLGRLIQKYNNLELALAAYNAGEGNVAKYNGIPPFPETQTYIKRVLAHYQSH